MVFRARSREPSRDHQSKVSVTAARRSLTAILDPQDPEAQLAAELGLQVRMPHKQDPGARARAPRQKGVQSGRRRRRYQLDGDKLASANSAEAACQESSPRFHVSLVDLCRPTGAETDDPEDFRQGVVVIPFLFALIERGMLVDVCHRVVWSLLASYWIITVLRTFCVTLHVRFA